MEGKRERETSALYSSTHHNGCLGKWRQGRSLPVDVPDKGVETRWASLTDDSTSQYVTLRTTQRDREKKRTYLQPCVVREGAEGSDGRPSIPDCSRLIAPCSLPPKICPPAALSSYFIFTVVCRRRSMPYLIDQTLAVHCGVWETRTTRWWSGCDSRNSGKLQGRLSRDDSLMYNVCLYVCVGDLFSWVISSLSLFLSCSVFIYCLYFSEVVSIYIYVCEYFLIFSFLFIYCF